MIMKKIILAAALVVGSVSSPTFVGTEQPIEAQAKTKDMASTIEKSLKKGSLPKAKMKLGTPYKTALKKVKNREWSDYVGFYPKNASTYGTPGYYFDAYGTADLKSTSPVVAIAATYNYYFSDKSVNRFGKIVKRSSDALTVDTIHRVGKYQVLIQRNKKHHFTLVSVELADKKFKYVSKPLFH